MAILLIPDVQTYSSYTARYAGNNSQQDNYPFSNCTADRAKMWLEWRSGYSSSLTHDITISTDLANATGLAMIGCNFQTITVSSQTKTLSYNATTGDYNGFFQVLLPSGTAFQIPAQTVADGYFRCKAIILGVRNPYNYYSPRYPLKGEVEHSRIAPTLMSGLSRITKGAERKSYFVLDCAPHYSALISNAVSMAMTTMPMQTRVAITFEEVAGETHYCQRVSELELTENAYMQYQMQLVFKEL